jgi:hypothetical protein
MRAARESGHIMNSALFFQKGTPRPVMEGSKWPWAIPHHAWE